MNAMQNGTEVNTQENQERGYIHIYTGNGKGKTTAAFGLAVRALCAGKTVYIGQFVKSMKYNETGLGEKFHNLSIEQLGRGCFIDRNPEKTDIEMATSAFEKCKELIVNNAYDMIILDELCIAMHFSLVDRKTVTDFFRNYRYRPEIVITGRYAPQELVDLGDIVTEMKEIRHYYSKGILSRNGIDR